MNRKQNGRPNQSARKQMLQNLSFELFANPTTTHHNLEEWRPSHPPTNPPISIKMTVPELVQPILDENEGDSSQNEPEEGREEVVEIPVESQFEQPIFFPPTQSILPNIPLEPSATPAMNIPLMNPNLRNQDFEMPDFKQLAESLNIAPLPANTLKMLPTSPWPSRWDQQADGIHTKYPTSTSVFEARKVGDRMTNPFANRKKINLDNVESTNINRKTYDSKDLADDFSNMSTKFTPNRLNRSSCDQGVMLPSWWKSRSFSSATCYYPQNVKSQVRGITTMNVPSHGNLEDIDHMTVTNQPYHRKNDLMARKEKWARIKAKKRILRRPVEDDYLEDADEEEEIMGGKGIVLTPIVPHNPNGVYEDVNLLRKYRRDVSYIKEVLTKEVDGNLDGIRELRFLIASVQTYGNIDGQCMMAEVAMNEFTLFAGILERFHAIVGPWTTDNETQRRRASRQAFETHKIPLQHNFATISKRKLVEEILGRSEPSVAFRQGVRVGLYSETCDEQFRVNLNLKNGQKDSAMVVDENDRRFILVLQNELEDMLESMKHLAKTVGLQYPGFPTHSDRFVIVEAFVEAVGELLGDTIEPEYMKHLSILGQKTQNDNSTPIEKTIDLHCFRHSESKNSFCAQLTVCRTNFIIKHVLGLCFRRYHLSKIPANAPSIASATTHSSILEAFTAKV